MENPDWSAPLAAAYDAALGYLTGLPEAPVHATASAEELLRALDGPLPQTPRPPAEVVAQLAAAVRPGLVNTQSGRFFGFVVGGAAPAALAADWLTATWDQNTGLYALAPAASIIEEVAGRWLREILELPAHASVAFVTGAQMANFTALAAARNEMLHRVGWDVEARGLNGAPPLRILAGEQRHDSIDRAARFLGLGRESIVDIPVDEQGRMVPSALAAALAGQPGPVIVCAQAGGVNTGAVDPLDEICSLAHEAGAWVHVDGAFGLWAAASERLRPLLTGARRADSWATDAHKWLNVPYDSGLVFCAHPRAHVAAMTLHADYLIQGINDRRDPIDYTPEFSRRARALPVYAAIRALGRAGIAELVERCCAAARRFAERLGHGDRVEILNDVVLNQVVVRFAGPGGDHDADNRAIVEAVQNDGTCWMSGTTWRGAAAMRISVSNWSTDQDDVDRSVAAILRCADRVLAGRPDQPTR